MKKITPLLILFLTISAFFSTIVYVKLNEIAPTDRFPALIEVPPGTSYNTLIKLMRKKGLTQAYISFKIYNKIKKVSSSIKPGRYRFEEPISGIEIIGKIVSGESELIKITIPEGYRLREIKEEITKHFPIQKEKLENYLSNQKIIKKLTKNQSTSLEGFCYPETYFYNYYADPKLIIHKMVGTFYEKLDSIWNLRPENFSYNFYETLILASIIQKETYDNTEYGKVSSVYHNRLRKKMRLQACPTVQYLLEKNKKLLYEDLKIESPYNTYLRRGLPPTPICSPSDSAFYYAVFPETTDYYYFVAEINGKHHFSKTLEEHNQKKLEIKKQKRRLKYEY